MHGATLDAGAGQAHLPGAPGRGRGRVARRREGCQVEVPFGIPGQLHPRGLQRELTEVDAARSGVEAGLVEPGPRETRQSRLARQAEAGLGEAQVCQREAGPVGRAGPASRWQT
ncbi:hypothetical protein WDZ92_50875 [Nostoc sp. NIES-2111]